MATITSLGFSIFSPIGTGSQQRAATSTVFKTTLTSLARRLAFLELLSLRLVQPLRQLVPPFWGWRSPGYHDRSRRIAEVHMCFSWTRRSINFKLAKAHKDLTPVQQTFVNSVNQ